MTLLAVLVAFVAYAEAQKKEIVPPLTKLPTPPPMITINVTVPNFTKLPTPPPIAPPQHKCKISADCGSLSDPHCSYRCEKSLCLVQCKDPPPPEQPKDSTCRVAADCGKAEAYCGYDCADGQCMKWCQSQPPALDGSNGTQHSDDLAPHVNEVTATFASGPTCMDIKLAYQKQSCCRDPNGSFTFPMKRRLLKGNNDADSHDARNGILGRIEAVMKHMRQIGGAAKVKMFARAAMDLVAPYAATPDHVDPFN